MGLFLLLEIFRGLHIIMQKKWEVLGMIGVDWVFPMLLGQDAAACRLDSVTWRF